MIDLDYEKMNGLVPVVIQESATNEILMLACMNKQAFEKTIQEGKVTFYSRTRKRLWTKGECSGHYLDVEEVLVDCDNDSLVIRVKPNGPVCHTENKTCFYRKLDEKGELNG